MVQIKVQLNLPVLGEGKKRRPRLFRKPKALVMMISVSRYFTHLLQGAAKRKATWIKAGGGVPDKEVRIFVSSSFFLSLMLLAFKILFPCSFLY